MAVTTNFLYNKGETWILNLDLRNSNSLPLDLTGGYVEMAVCPLNANNKLIYINTANCPGSVFRWANQAAGLGTLYVYANQQGNLVSNTSYRYQIESVTSANIIGMQCNGMVKIATSLFWG